MSARAAVGCAAALLWVLWPFLLPGDLLARDMVVTSSMSLTPAAVGFSSLPARAVPQDGVLALIPGAAPVVARLLIAAAAWLGARGAYRLGGVPGVWVMAVSPFVVQRLLQGHWSLVVAVLVLPAIVAARTRWERLGAVWLACLTPTGAIVAAVVGLVSARGRAEVLAASALFSLPWLVPSIGAHTAASTAGMVAFAPRGVSDANMVLQVLGTGGVWNAAADLPARAGWGPAVWVSAALTCVCVAAASRRWRLLGAVGLFAAVVVGVWPAEVGALLAHVPGSGVLRDGQKLVMLAVPAVVVGAGALTARGSRRVASAVLIVSCVVGVWGAPAALREITPTGGPRLEFLAEQLGGRQLLIVPGSTTVEWHGRTVVDPRAKAFDVLSPGSLVVDSVVVDPPVEEYVVAAGAYRAGDFARLAQLGVGAVLDQATGELVMVPGASVSRPYWVGVVLVSAYGLCGLLLAVSPMLGRWLPRTGWRLWRGRPAPAAGG